MATLGESVIVCVAFITATASGVCLNGWTTYGESCYRIFDDTLNQTEAQFQCEHYDAFLATLETKNESDSIYSLLNELNIGESYNLWIGLTDARQEGHWEWEHNKQSAVFLDWAHNEPNQKGTTEQDCASLYGQQGFKWADVRCEKSLQYICERP